MKALELPLEGFACAGNRATSSFSKNIAKEAGEVNGLTTTYRVASRHRALVPMDVPTLPASPIDAYVEMGRVTRAVCDTVGERDRRCEDAKNLYAGLGAVLVVGIGIVALAALFRE